MLATILNGRKRQFWLLIGVAALLMNAFALMLQYQMDMKPCSKCIDQRIALYLISITAFIGSAFNQTAFVSKLPQLLTLSAVGYATYISVDHYLLTTATNPFALSCSLEPNLPKWMPLHEWIPSVFNPTGMCGKTGIEVLGIGLVQWTMIGCITLSAYAIVGFSGIAKIIKQSSKEEK